VVTAVLSCVAQIPQQYAANKTAYHLNPLSAGALPVNMDTGDVFGDLYFYLGQYLLPLECANVSQKTRSHFDCDNPERVDPNLVVTRVDLEVDTRFWTQYSACNLCNGSDPFTHKPCKKGTYICDHGHHGGSQPLIPKGVGFKNITEDETPSIPSTQCLRATQETCGAYVNNSDACEYCVYNHEDHLDKACPNADPYEFCPDPFSSCNGFHSGPEWACWLSNIPRKTGGVWYSTLAEGLCNETSAPGSCGWKALSVKTVKAECLSNVLVSTVESHDKAGCFKGCGPRNQTSSCWISCFFDTLLGKDARHTTSLPMGGISKADLEKGWTNAFLPKAEGGCDEVPIPYTSDAYVSELIV